MTKDDYFDWTANRCAFLEILWCNGATAREIADALGTTKNSVIGKAHRMKLPPRRNPIKR